MKNSETAPLPASTEIIQSLQDCLADATEVQLLRWAVDDKKMRKHPVAANTENNS
jgi:hypothetical protein